jgi:multidrug resistance efflux pump
VEKPRIIIFLVPDGTLVKKGNLVCELDSSDLNDKLIDLAIAIKRAENDRRIGQLNQEVAIGVLKEYKEGTYIQDKIVTNREVKRAESNLAVASDRVDQITKMFRKGEVSQGDKVAAELAFQETKFALELAQNQVSVLENFTKPNTLKRLISEVEKARSQEVSAQEILELERARVETTRRQIENCRLLAPSDGRVVLGTTPARARINEGDTVRERQLLFTIVPVRPGP